MFLLFARPNVETVVSLSKNFEKPKDYVQIGIDAEDYPDRFLEEL